MTTLLGAVRRYADANADRYGIAQTPISGLTTVRATAPSDLAYAIPRASDHHGLTPVSEPIGIATPEAPTSSTSWAVKICSPRQAW